MRPSLWEQDVWYAKADLIVVGAGITGLSAALFHKRLHPRARVLVLERGWLPSGASTRNAGFACFGSVSELLDDLGSASEEDVIARVAKRIRGLALLREELGDEAISFDPCGGYEIFTDRSEFERCVDQMPRLNELLEAAAGIRQAYHVSQVNGYPAIACPSEGGIHSGRMMQALRGKLLAEGVEVMHGAKVVRVSEAFGENGPSVMVEGGGVLRARDVLIATNGFTTSLLQQSDRDASDQSETARPIPRIEPARGMILLSKPFKELAWRGIFHYNLGYVYFRHVEGDRLLLGGARDVDKATERTPEEGLNPTIREWLLTFAEQVLRVPLRETLEMEWSGTMGFTDMKSPYIGPYGPGRWIAAGLSGIGVSIGMDVGREIATRIAQARSVTQ